ncbi:pyridoxal phosphate (PLP)-dependent transferasessuperfamily protein [Striga asiatica]|uniref:Pyridoxal phosphate (PLP)-dependent transferasessuperfamily protein n=1 Tax=Striga asiatica TaxID=4170 RepID=A0A5A7P0U5_STRAF|nr:pyridoxal phosphate (PLP)-dependent transferasessuperfamily protein [Striga asiatica]
MIPFPVSSNLDLLGQNLLACAFPNWALSLPDGGCPQVARRKRASLAVYRRPSGVVRMTISALLEEEGLLGSLSPSFWCRPEMLGFRPPGAVAVDSGVFRGACSSSRTVVASIGVEDRSYSALSSLFPWCADWGGGGMGCLDCRDRGAEVDCLGCGIGLEPPSFLAGDDDVELTIEKDSAFRRSARWCGIDWPPHVDTCGMVFPFFRSSL